jgi:WRKY transcription factor 33
MTPPSLPLSPSLMSPSSYFNMPAGMNLADFLDSPVLLTSSVSKNTNRTNSVSTMSFHSYR